MNRNTKIDPPFADNVSAICRISGVSAVHDDPK